MYYVPKHHSFWNVPYYGFSTWIANQIRGKYKLQKMVCYNVNKIKWQPLQSNLNYFFALSETPKKQKSSKCHKKIVFSEFKFSISNSLVTKDTRECNTGVCR